MSDSLLLCYWQNCSNVLHIIIMSTFLSYCSPGIKTVLKVRVPRNSTRLDRFQEIIISVPSAQAERMRDDAPSNGVMSPRQHPRASVLTRSSGASVAPVNPAHKMKRIRNPQQECRHGPWACARAHTGMFSLKRRRGARAWDGRTVNDSVSHACSLRV